MPDLLITITLRATLLLLPTHHAVLVEQRNQIFLRVVFGDLEGRVRA
jgi:hypothetical protein